MVRGEIAVVQVNVFNYHPEDLEVRTRQIYKENEETYLLACAPNEDSNQIRVFVDRMKKRGYLKCADLGF